MQKEKKRRRGWGTAKCVSDASHGRWKCRKSEGWSVGRLGAMGFWLHAYHFKRQPVKGSLLLCKPRSIFLCVSLLLTRGEVDHFWPNSYGLICCAVFILWDNLCPGEAAHSVARVSLSSTLSYLMWAAAVMECNIFGVWHCCFNSSSSPPGGERRGGRLSHSDLCYVNTTLLFLKYGSAFFRATILLSAVFCHPCAVSYCHKNDLKQVTTACRGPVVTSLQMCHEKVNNPERYRKEIGPYGAETEQCVDEQRASWNVKPALRCQSRTATDASDTTMRWTDVKAAFSLSRDSWGVSQGWVGDVLDFNRGA